MESTGAQQVVQTLHIFPSNLSVFFRESHMIFLGPPIPPKIWEKGNDSNQRGDLVYIVLRVFSHKYI